MNEIEDLVQSMGERSVSRRSLIRSLSLSAGSAAVGMALAACGGSGSSSSAQGNNASIGSAAPVAAEIAFDEQQHVRYLRTALGGNGIAKPAIDLSMMDGTLANFLVMARHFEDVGISAYGGAAPLITDKGILGTAARILATEALHTGNIRLQIAARGIADSAVDGLDILPPSNTSPAEPPSAGSPEFFTVDSNALSIVRTPAQVAAIVLGGAGNTKGGFFPAGINGNFPPANDTDILNFALNLEYLEAEFYTWALTGAGIDALGIAITGNGTQGVTTGAKKVNFG